ncbi:MAG: Lrp/AsnC family transcriptional regulator [Desulfobacterales bacterium]|nr:Lrp/AsnC family transcriptional regulator [Desulfobacterales bacterium]
MTKKRNAGKEKGIDKIDCRIIELLQQDGRLSNTAMAKELGIAEATIRARLKRLIREEYIRIVAVGDPYKLGFGIMGNLKIRMDIKKKESVIESLRKIKELNYISLTTGSMDVDVDFIVKSLDVLNNLLYDRIFKIDGILATETSLILENVKDDYAWGTAIEE